MIKAVSSLALALAAMTHGAQAGPWARDPGAAFLSYTISADSTQDAITTGSFDGRLYHSAYGEIGLGRRLTFGFDLGGDEATRQGSAFLRYTFTPAGATWQYAVDGGLGFRDVDGADTTDLYRIGTSVGRGFGRETLDFIPYLTPQGGWVSLDTFAMIDPEGDMGFWSSEATFGLELSDRFGALMQLKAEEYPAEDLAVFVSPNLLWYLGEATTAQIGGRFGVTGSEEVGLRAGLWQDF